MTDSTTTIAPVVREAVVGAPIETCFTTFVDNFDSWWPPEHHIGERDIVSFHIDPTVGGRCYDIDTDGVECQWGTVLVIEPPTRFVLAWHIQADWTIDLDPDRQSEVELTLEALGPERTNARLEHRRFERHGSAGADLRESVAGAGGWGALLERFVDVAEGRPPRALSVTPSA